MSNPVNDFLESAIRGLKQNYFENLIVEFQKEYWKATEVIITDGTSDGGNDLRIYEGKLSVKKVVQLTVQKNIKDKIIEDLDKASELISKHGYSNNFEYYWSQSISNETLQEYKDTARQSFGIDLQFYDAKVLSQINCKCIKEYIYNLHGEVVKKDLLKVDKTSKVLFDLLAIGNETSEIKNNLLHSFIVFFLFEKNEALAEEICTNINQKLNETIDSRFLLRQLNLLKNNDRIELKEGSKTVYKLSSNEADQITNFVKQSDFLEKSFEGDFTEILKKYKLESESEKIIDYLKSLYKTNYQLDIDEENKKLDFSDSVFKIYSDFQVFIEKKLASRSKAKSVIKEIKELCSNNDYINRITIGSTFTSLYKSDKLDTYLTQNQKTIYMDTPLLVFFICHKYTDINLKSEWDDIFYKTTINLIDIWENADDQIHLKTMYDYLKEAAGELQKALRTANFLELDFIEDLGDTKNSFINYYRFLKSKDLFESADIIDFTDFILDLGFENVDPDNRFFIEDTARYLKTIFEDYEIEIINHQNYPDFEDLRREYEISLMGLNKTKTRTAILNDLRLIRYLADPTLHTDPDSGQYLEPFFCTWDTTFYHFRKKILTKYKDKYSFYHIYNPARLINKICLERFNINSDILTNDIFAYAEANYNISSKVKSLLDIIAPIIGKTVKKNIRLIKHLGEIRKKQFEYQSSKDEGIDPNTNLPIEEVFIDTINYFHSPDVKITFDDFSAVFCNENNYDLIVNFVLDGLDNIKNHNRLEKRLLKSLESKIESIIKNK